MRCACAAASLGYGLLLADVLSPADMGEFAIAVSVAVIAATIAKCGLDVHVLRRAAERPEAARYIAVRSLALAGLAGTFGAVACAAVGFGVRLEAASTFGAMLSAIPFLAMSFVLSGLLKAGDRPAAAIFLETGGWQTAMCVCAIVMHYAGSDSPAVVAVCFAAGSAMALAAFLVFARRLLYRPESGHDPGNPMLGIRFREVAPLAGVSVCHVVMRWSDVLWLAWWFDAATVAVYAVCTRLAGGIAFIDHAVNAIAAPRFARHHGRRAPAGLRIEFRRACGISGSWGILGAAAIAMLAPLVLNRLGPPYADAVGVVQAAAVLMAVHVTLAPVGHLAAMSGRAVDHLKAISAMLALQQAVYLVAIPHLGMAGALFGFALPQICANFLTLRMLRRRGEFGWLAR